MLEWIKLALVVKQQLFIDAAQ